MISVKIVDVKIYKKTKRVIIVPFGNFLKFILIQVIYQL